MHVNVVTVWGMLQTGHIPCALRALLNRIMFNNKHWLITCGLQVYGDHKNVAIWERIWEKGPIGNFFTNSIPEKLPF